MTTTVPAPKAVLAAATTVRPQAFRVLANTGPAPVGPLLAVAGTFLTVGAVLVADPGRRRH